MLFVIVREVMKLAEAIDLVYLKIVLFFVDDTHGCLTPRTGLSKRAVRMFASAVGVMPFVTIATN